MLVTTRRGEVIAVTNPLQDHDVVLTIEA